MVLDGLTVLAAATVATLYKLHTGPVGGARGFVHGTLFQGRSMSILMKPGASFGRQRDKL